MSSRLVLASVSAASLRRCGAGIWRSTNGLDGALVDFLDVLFKLNRGRGRAAAGFLVLAIIFICPACEGTPSRGRAAKRMVEDWVAALLEIWMGAQGREVFFSISLRRCFVEWTLLENVLRMGKWAAARSGRDYATFFLMSFLLLNYFY